MTLNEAERSMSGPTTIADVAIATGLSASTVSRALSGRGTMRPETRQRVVEAARLLRYNPNPAAQALREKQGRTLGISASNLANPDAVEFIRGAQHIARRHGYSVIIADGQGSAQLLREELAALLRQRVAGLLLAGYGADSESLRMFSASGVLVEPEPLYHGNERVGVADFEMAATQAAIRTLYRLGHRRLAFFQRAQSAEYDPPSPAAGRGNLIRQLLTDLVGTELMIVSVDITSHHDSVEIDLEVQRLMSLASPPTAFIAGAPILTPPLLVALYRSGLAIPGDVSVLAYGDSDWALAHRPPLSVIRRDEYAVGADAAARLIARLSGSTTSDPPLLLAQFLRRDSIAVARD